MLDPNDQRGDNRLCGKHSNHLESEGVAGRRAFAFSAYGRKSKPPALRVVVDSFCRRFFMSLNHLVLALEASTKAGTTMVFGYLGGGALPYVEKFPGSSFILAFQALLLILVISAISSLLFYWKILQCVLNKSSIRN